MNKKIFYLYVTLLFIVTTTKTVSFEDMRRNMNEMHEKMQTQMIRMQRKMEAEMSRFHQEISNLEQAVYNRGSKKYVQTYKTQIHRFIREKNKKIIKINIGKDVSDFQAESAVDRLTVYIPEKNMRIVVEILNEYHCMRGNFLVVGIIGSVKTAKKEVGNKEEEFTSQFSNMRVEMLDTVVKIPEAKIHYDKKNGLLEIGIPEEDPQEEKSRKIEVVVK